MRSLRPESASFVRGVLRLALLAGMGMCCGCASIGPGTVARDRFDYSRSISDSWKRQTLLNIVKLRYLDTPIYVDVGQIVAGYSLETEVNLSASAVDAGDKTLGLGGVGRYTDRPTVTYTPLTGNRFIRSSLMPLPPDAVFFMLQAEGGRERHEGQGERLRAA